MKLHIHPIACGTRVSGTVALGMGVDGMRPGATSASLLFHGYAGAERWSTPSTPREARALDSATLRFGGRNAGLGLEIDDDFLATPTGPSADPSSRSVHGMITLPRPRPSVRPQPRFAESFLAK